MKWGDRFSELLETKEEYGKEEMTTSEFWLKGTGIVKAFPEMREWVALNRNVMLWATLKPIYSFGILRAHLGIMGFGCFADG